MALQSNEKTSEKTKKFHVPSFEYTKQDIISGKFLNMSIVWIKVRYEKSRIRI